MSADVFCERCGQPPGPAGRHGIKNLGGRDIGVCPDGQPWGPFKAAGEFPDERVLLAGLSMAARVIQGDPKNMMAELAWEDADNMLATKGKHYMGNDEAAKPKPAKVEINHNGEQVKS